MFMIQIQNPSKSSMIAVFAVFRARVPIQDLKTSMMEETSAEVFVWYCLFMGDQIHLASSFLCAKLLVSS